MASQAYIDNLHIGDKITFRHPWRPYQRYTRIVRGTLGTAETGCQIVLVKHNGMPQYRVERRHIIED